MRLFFLIFKVKLLLFGNQTVTYEYIKKYLIYKSYIIHTSYYIIITSLPIYSTYSSIFRIYI